MQKFLKIVGWVVFVIVDLSFFQMFQSYLNWGAGRVEPDKAFVVGFIFFLPLLILNVPAFFIIKKKLNIPRNSFNFTTKMYNRIDSENSTTLTYNTFLTYILYSSIIILYFTISISLTLSLIPIAMLVYSLSVWFNSSKDRDLISTHAKLKGVELRGSKFSFSNPLTVTISQQHVEVKD